MLQKMAGPTVVETIVTELLESLEDEDEEVFQPKPKHKPKPQPTLCLSLTAPTSQSQNVASRFLNPNLNNNP